MKSRKESLTINANIEEVTNRIEEGVPGFKPMAREVSSDTKTYLFSKNGCVVSVILLRRGESTLTDIQIYAADEKKLDSIIKKVRNQIENKGRDD